jgi:FKBP-type peptidyl-prolyl cis-trans isomerase FkpA
MKTKLFSALLLLSFFLYACKKSSTGTTCTTVMGQPSTAEVDALRNHLTTSGLTATEDPRGFFYNIAFAGTGSASPTLASNVTVQYKGTLINGTVFDSTVTGINRTFPLGNLITGWQWGLPLIKKGGIINLYLPPSLGYGCASQGKVPSNAFTIFRVELIDF